MSRNAQLTPVELKQLNKVSQWLVTNKEDLLRRLPPIEQTLEEATKALGFDVTPRLLALAQTATDVAWRGKRDGGVFNTYEFCRSAVLWIADCVPKMRAAGIDVTVPAKIQDWINSEQNRKPVYKKEPPAKGD